MACHGEDEQQVPYAGAYIGRGVLEGRALQCVDPVAGVIA